MLLDTEHTPLPSRSLLSPRWMCPFRVLARTAPKAYRLDIPATSRPRGASSPSSTSSACAPPPPSRPPRRRRGCGPAAAGSGCRRRARARGAGAAQVQDALRPALRAGALDRPGRGDRWEPLDNLTNCEAAIAAFEQATGRSLPRPPPPFNAARRRRRRAPPIPLAGFTFDAAPPGGGLGAALLGRVRVVLYWWPDDGWQRETVPRLCPRGAFPHVVAYTRQASALRGMADTLLE